MVIRIISLRCIISPPPCSELIKEDRPCAYNAYYTVEVGSMLYHKRGSLAPDAFKAQYERRHTVRSWSISYFKY